MKEVIVVLLDRFADWEAAFLAPALRGGTMPRRQGYCEVKYLTPDGRAVRSIGGLQATPDYAAGELPAACAGLILAGGMGWDAPEAAKIVPLVEEARRRGLLVGAICNAVSFLAAHGFLNDARHTGNTLEMLQQWGGDNYTGAARYEEKQAVRDGNLVTANGSGYLEFTRECLLALGADTPEAIASSYAFNKHGFYKE
ncbi:MAG: glutamine amidotransferase [Alistipes sp.]|nr:glutamine amidotransferase [Alistipes senegalensis]MCM1249526.1 glutamine amidotransferase [Alistipes sp.]